jgi:hypothetical protein
MTRQASPDLLDLAEAVAHGDLRADEAERQVRAALGPNSEDAVRELRGLVVGASAVRAHVRATREAFGTATPEPARATSATATIVPGLVTAGAVRRHSRRDSSGGRAPRRMWLLVAATLAVGTGLVGISLAGNRQAVPSPEPSIDTALVNATSSPGPQPSADLTPVPSPMATRNPVVSPSPAPSPVATSRPAAVIAYVNYVSKGISLGDGKQIVFSVLDKMRNGSAVFIVDADGQNLRQLSSSKLPARLPDWSPDGSRIVFTSFVSTRLQTTQDVYTVRPDWTDLRRLTTGGDTIGATWTPDGRILFATGCRGDPCAGNGGLWTMDADGSNVQLLVPGSGDGAWQPTP